MKVGDFEDGYGGEGGFNRWFEREAAVVSAQGY